MLCHDTSIYLLFSMLNLFTEEDKDADDELSYKHTIENLCLYVIHHWLKEVQLTHVAVQQFIDMRRENVSVLIKEAMPICSEEEVDAFVKHDDGVHVHKLIAAVNNVRAHVFFYKISVIATSVLPHYISSYNLRNNTLCCSLACFCVLKCDYETTLMLAIYCCG
jgi:hypothetical protein